MAKTKFSEFDSTPGNNSDINSINVAEGMLPSDVNNAFRQLMAYCKDFISGTSGDTLTTASIVATTADINGGTIDGATIGARTAASASFTILSASQTASLTSSVNVGATATDVAVMNSQVEFNSNSREKTTVVTTSASGTINFNILDQSVLVYTADAAANWELNVRGNASATFASVVATGETSSLAFESSQGGTAYYLDAIQIDGSTASPVYWQGGTAPSAGNASGYDSYLVNITRTSGTANYTCLASQTQFGKVTY